MLTGGYGFEHINAMDANSRDRIALTELAKKNWQQICEEVSAQSHHRAEVVADYPVDGPNPDDEWILHMARTRGNKRFYKKHGIDITKVGL